MNDILLVILIVVGFYLLVSLIMFFRQPKHVREEQIANQIGLKK